MQVHFFLLKDIDLSGLKRIELAGMEKNAACSFEVRLDAVDGKLIGQCGANPALASLETTAGRHNVYVVFTGTGGSITTINMKDK